MRMTLLGGGSAFAHLAGLVPVRGSRRAEEEDDKNGKGRRSRRSEEDDDDKDARAEDDPEQYPDDNDDQPQGRRSEEDDDDKDAEDDDDEKDARRARRARAEDDDDDKDAEDDDDKEEMSGKSVVAKARARERARCRAIFSHPVAAENIPLAASLAFDTTMTRKEALAVLKGQRGREAPTSSRDDRSRRRAAGNADLGPSGGETRPTGQKALNASWGAAFERAGVKPR